MIAPKDTYEKTKRIDNIEDVAYDRLFTNYLKRDVKGDAKMIEIDDTDQESVLNKRSLGLPFIGMIYTFIYVNDQALIAIQNMASGKQIQFHDFTPILFCTNINAKTGLIKGLNLNLLPKESRLNFLQSYWEVYKPFFQKIEEKTQYNKEALNKTYQSAALSGENPKLFELFNKKQSENFGFAYRSYDIKHVRKLRMIEYEEWQYIPFFDARLSFKKTNLNAIYNTYRDNLNKLT